jgi:hypothetical protein
MGEFVARLADVIGLKKPHVIGRHQYRASLFAAALHPARLRSLVVGRGGAGFRSVWVGC